MQGDKRDIKSMFPDELSEMLIEIGEPGFRAEQLFKWLHKPVRDFDEMTDLPKSLRKALSERFYITVPELVSKQVSDSDGTVKFLWGMEDGSAIETVAMNYRHGWSLCLSSQVGCGQGCAFCASTIGGLLRNLEPSEILDQVLFSEQELGISASNIVLMGIGEPLDNFDNVLRFLRLINHPKGRCIGMRHITLSTCAPKGGIDKLGEHNLQLTLSVSLHAPDDETRSQLMPVNRQSGVGELLEASENYFEKTGRRVSFEYALIDGINDTPRQAVMLAEAAKRLSAHVNLILLNRVEGRTSEPSRNLRNFTKILEDSGAKVTIRRRLGSDVDAACGQLRRRYSSEKR